VVHVLAMESEVHILDVYVNEGVYVPVAPHRACQDYTSGAIFRRPIIAHEWVIVLCRSEPSEITEWLVRCYDDFGHLLSGDVRYDAK
jgi:hypothetical protein